MTSYYGTNGSTGASGGNGTGSPNGTTPATPGGGGTGGTAGGDLDFDITQSNLDPDVAIYGGTGGGGGYGGYGGSGTTTMTYTQNGAGYTVSGSGASTAGRNGGAGAAAGRGGNVTLGYDGVTTSQVQYLTANAGSAYGGGGGGNGGHGVYGSSISNPYANGYYDSNSVLHYYGYSETVVGSIGGAGGMGGRGGDGGISSVTVQNSSFRFAFGSYEPYVVAQGNYGSAGGYGGSGGNGNTGGVGGRGGNGGTGGSATILVDHITSYFSSTIYLYAKGYAGGAGGAGGHGGYGQVSHTSYSAPGVGSTTYDYHHGAGGQGGTGGNGGSASIDYDNNTVTGTAGGDNLSLTFDLTAGGGGAGGAGGTNGDYTVTAASGASGASGTTHLGFTGNVFNGAGGTDTLNLYINNTFAGPSGFTAMGAVYINLATGVFKIGAETSTIKNVENLHLYQSDGYYLSGVWQNFVASATLIGNDSANSLYGSVANDTLNGGAGDDLVDGGSGADSMTGGTGDDTFYVDNAGDTVVEGANGGDDVVNSTVSFVLGAQYIETLNLTGYTDANGTGNGYDNLINGNGYVNVLVGANGDDVLNGNGGNDTLNGGNNDDTMDGGAGVDTMNGGAGDDTYYVDDSGDHCNEGLNAGADVVYAAVDYTLGANIETLVLYYYSNINGTGNNLANTLIGTSGNNRLDGAAGADLMVGGYGNDTFVIDNAGDVASETAGQGNDTVETNLTWSLGANLENLTLTGSANINGTGNGLANILTGNAGNNSLNGVAGADTMYGMAGNDSYYVDNAGDIVSEDSTSGVDDGGADRVFSTVSFTLGDFIENLTLQGAAAIDGTGNGVVNNIVGNAAANTIRGMAGNDSMTGGGGNDTFVFEHFGVANGTDYIADFASGSDRLSFTAADFGWTAGHVLTAAELSTNTAVGAGGQFVFNTTNHVLYWDNNGATAGGLSAIVNLNAATPATGDFVFT